MDCDYLAPYAWGPRAGQPVAPTAVWSRAKDHGGMDD